ncbi:Uncharacterised protein [Segatella buccae]|uniref:Uncharacterized protein n=2 Tax=Segatella buccae TaxID=28126 RepID=E6K443_9BACT|nr:hypothetical protein HMPREF6485_0449 [Segatella buccae ATCC 33574]EJP31438.1 hypothetical protein HMPREF1146_2079 [Prevotella sp. MSX73]SUB80493.1 Uncharacterised protein [Segatella buccae]
MTGSKYRNGCGKSQMQKRNVINHTPTAHAIYKRTILFANIWNLSDY